MHHSYWACALQQKKSPKWEAHAPVKSSPRSLQPDYACTQKQGPRATNKYIFKGLIENFFPI